MCEDAEADSSYDTADLLATSPGLPLGSTALPCDDMLVSREDKYDKTTTAEAFAIVFIVLIVVGSCIACSVFAFMSRRRQSMLIEENERKRQWGKSEIGPLMLAGHNDGRDLAVGSFLCDASNGGGWMEQLHGGRGRFVYVSSSPSNKREYAFVHSDGMPTNCYRIESIDRKGLTVMPFHEQRSVNQGRAKPRSEGNNTSFVCVWEHPPEKSTWEFEPHAGGGFLLKLKVHGWARCHGRSIDVYENKGYLAVTNDHKLDVRDSSSYYVHITNQKAGAAIWAQLANAPPVVHAPPVVQPVVQPGYVQPQPYPPPTGQVVGAYPPAGQVVYAPQPGYAPQGTVVQGGYQPEGYKPEGY